ncbi:hypothetical protein L1987_82498 [Smallanthus sonchifolius]|uniref:Uncharacterized protein n=1 Tax=Smallanthus sonchifolius TaxID=185202 RepID=A0ACB8YBI0_9ASTR|nr:hypothetical protein L1987_82498 [Smallanthus sonchifolius]
MADLRPLLFMFLHLACFIIFYTSHHRPKPPSPTNLKPISSTWSSSFSFIKRIFSSKSTLPPDHHLPTRPGSDYLPLRNQTEIHPCPNCGEIFQKPGSLEQHQSIKHAVCEMSDDDPGKNVVRIIFGSGWPGEAPTIHRVMKIHNSPKILTRFEEYRESVKMKAARHGGPRPRCIADGNELLRFHCTTFMCDLGQNGNSTICSQQYCSVCGIIESGFSPKLDGISTLPNSWKGHVAVPQDIEEEFRFMGLKRAMLVCRVIAGRVGCDPGMSEKDDPGYDSLVGAGSGAARDRLDEEDELIVFNPRAVLPCFVIVYTV